MWFVNYLNPYFYIIKLRRYLYKTNFILKPKIISKGRVISVGNIELGGTGKTPFVVGLLNELLNGGFKPALLTRGYKSAVSNGDWVWLKNQKIVASNRRFEVQNLFADEAMLVSFHCPEVPVIIGARRFENAERFLIEDATITHWILDDGFQHLQVVRNVDFVLCSSLCREPHPKLLPFGYFREDLASLKRANALISTDDELSSYLKSSHPHVYTFKPMMKYYQLSFAASHAFVPKPIVLSEDLTKRNMFVFTGIARPQLLVKNLKEKSFNICGEILKGDHEKFSSDDFDILKRAEEAGWVLVSTLKDYFRDPVFFQRFSPGSLVCCEKYFNHDDYVEILPLLAD